jgi:hypothetical protein
MFVRISVARKPLSTSRVGYFAGVADYGLDGRVAAGNGTRCATLHPLGTARRLGLVVGMQRRDGGCLGRRLT